MIDYHQANLLAIDTSSANLMLGVRFAGDRMVKSSEMIEKTHGQLIIKKIGDLLSTAEVETSGLDAIVAGIGPGSFTGLRIGLSAAKGMVVALDIPVVGVSCFEIAALRLASVGSTVAVLVPLNRDELFLAEIADGKVDLSDIEVVELTRLRERLGDMPVACFSMSIEAVLPDFDGENLSSAIEYDAADLIQLGAEKLDSGEIPALDSLEPLYLRKSQAEIRFEQRNKGK